MHKIALNSAATVAAIALAGASSPIAAALLNLYDNLADDELAALVEAMLPIEQRLTLPIRLS